MKIDFQKFEVAIGKQNLFYYLWILQFIIVYMV